MKTMKHIVKKDLVLKSNDTWINILNKKVKSVNNVAMKFRVPTHICSRHAKIFIDGDVINMAKYASCGCQVKYIEKF